MRLEDSKFFSERQSTIAISKNRRRDMNGNDLLNEFRHRIQKREKMAKVTDTVLAKELGLTQPALTNYKGRTVTPRQIAGLMEKFAKRAEKRLIDETLVPVVEFLPLTAVKHGAKLQIFSTTDGHPYLRGLKDKLDGSHGIYLFHDSRGRAIYAGKAQKQTLWTEINLAFNRDRGEVQSLKRVRHPTNRIQYKRHDEMKRRIVKEVVSLHHIARYLSVYQVPDRFISKLEALIVRSFANDLLNVRMESI
jgi:hypothetical protein